MQIGTEIQGEAAVPIPAPGIGTRISAALDGLGTRKNAAKQLGVSVDSLARYCREENTPPFDVAARLCAAAGRSLEWLATGVDPAKPLQDKPSGPSHALQLDHVKIAVQLLREAEEVAGRPPTWSADQQAEATAILVRLLSTGLPEAEVRAIAAQTTGLFSGGNQGAGPGRQASGR